MRRRPSGSASDEDHDASTPEVLPAAPTGHGDKANERQRGIEKVIQDGAHKKDRRKDTNAPVQPPTTGKTQLYTTAPSPRTETDRLAMSPLARDITPDSMVECHGRRRSRLRNPWACSLLTLATTLLGFGALFLMVQSFMTRQLDTKGCEMSYMRPAFAKYSDFDTEHTRFASKYSLYLYREGGIDEDIRVWAGSPSGCN